jgi:signal transduction histidine kinase
MESFMRYIFRITFALFLIIKLSVIGNVSSNEVIILLVIINLDVFKEKFYYSIYIVILEFAAILYISTINPYFLILCGPLICDVFYMKKYSGIIPAIIGGFYFLSLEKFIEYLFLLSLCGYFAYVDNSFNENKERFKEVYDRERCYRYELEDTKQKLLNSSKEVAHITEIKERNRISRQIHDNVGHSIAGILMQLQASYKLRGRDDGKSGELLDKSITGLQNSLTILRETVHNIKPQETLGVEYIKNIIDNFNFCTVNFKLTGDFNVIEANSIEILCTNIKEALTNASKYSNATNVDINIDITDKLTRLYIKDNGKGCTCINEGLGISGMRERIKNVGGSLSISSKDGFLMVAVIPRNTYKGGVIFEGANN